MWDKQLGTVHTCYNFLHVIKKFTNFHTLVHTVEISTNKIHLEIYPQMKTKPKPHN